jgi:hypothetical protein
MLRIEPVKASLERASHGSGVLPDLSEDIGGFENTPKHQQNTVFSRASPGTGFAS